MIGEIYIILILTNIFSQKYFNLLLWFRVDINFNDLKNLKPIFFFFYVPDSQNKTKLNGGTKFFTCMFLLRLRACYACRRKEAYPLGSSFLTSINNVGFHCDSPYAASDHQRQYCSCFLSPICL